MLASLFLVFLAVPQTAQPGGAPGAPPNVPRGVPQTAEVALEAYRASAGLPERERTAAIAQLGRFDAPDVTRALLDELARAQTVELERAVVSALGRQARAGALEALLDVLDQKQDYVLRNSAARGAALQGDAGVGALIERTEPFLELRAMTPQQRMARAPLLQGLGAAKTERAYAMLAEFAQRGAYADRLAALGQLASAPPGGAVTAARLEASSSPYLILALQGVAQLAAEPNPAANPEAKAAALKLHKKLVRSEVVSQRATLMRAFARILDKDTYGPFIEHAAYIDAEMDRTLGELAGEVSKDTEFVAWLMKRGIKLKTPRERAVAIRILARAEAEGITNALLKLVWAREPAVVFAAIRALGTRGDLAAVEPLLRVLRAPGSERKMEAVLGLQLLLKNDPSWKADLVPLLASQSEELRTLALDMLAELGATEVLPQVYRDLDHVRWQVRAAAYDFCRRVRHVDSIPLLIGRLDAEEGRMREDVLDALEALTGMRYLSRPLWDRWWRENRVGFELPPPKADREDRATRRGQGGRTVSYYNIPITSERTAFIIDHSGSMGAKIGTDGKRTRLDEAKRQLTLVVNEIPARFRFNILFFESRVRAVLPQLTAADEKTKSRSLAAVEALAPAGGTNIHDALELAFQDQDVDTIYLLSDGYPTTGKIRDPGALADEVARWNRTRRIRIHSIAVGSQSPLLKRLADESGGKYVWVR